MSSLNSIMACTKDTALSEQQLAAAVTASECSNLSIKILRRVIMYGFHEFHKNADVSNFVKILHDSLSKLLVSSTLLVAHLNDMIGDSFSPAVAKHINK